MSVVAPYAPVTGFDELVDQDGRSRPIASPLWLHLRRSGLRSVFERQIAAEAEVRSMGITFCSGADAERSWPFDVIPRLLDLSEWRRIDAGLTQRLQALNCFVDDMYHDQRILGAGVIPRETATSSPNFRPECLGVNPPGGVWVHICGSDIVRGADGTLYVLEDNLRVPSGVAYLLENRMIAKRVFPELFRSYSIEPVDHYVSTLAALLAAVGPQSRPGPPRLVLLTPGPDNSAYYEHAFLAQQLGAALVEGADLVVIDDEVFMQTIGGLEPVDVVYRRIDDLYLDPEAFRRDSLLGVRGLMRAWRAGNVALVNAPGTGVADDKAIYPYVPEMIRYYLGEDPLLATIPTWRCADEADRRYVLAHLDTLVVKPANESGGYGIVIGPQSTPDALAAAAAQIELFPPGWVAQPVVELSTMPTFCSGKVQPRHVDLRPFTLLGPQGAYVLPGGLTRVARAEGSLIVNSSQGGGSKDTWVIRGLVEEPEFPGVSQRDEGPHHIGATLEEGARTDDTQPWSSQFEVGTEQ